MRPPVRWLPALTTDGWLLFAIYSVRLAADGFVSVILDVYLAALGFEAGGIGLVFTAAVGGSGVTMAILSWMADRWGRLSGHGRAPPVRDSATASALPSTSSTRTAGPNSPEPCAPHRQRKPARTQPMPASAPSGTR